MIETQKSIPAPDGKRICYLETQASETRASKDIIIGHGMTGHAQEYIHQERSGIYGAGMMSIASRLFELRARGKCGLYACQPCDDFRFRDN